MTLQYSDFRYGEEEEDKQWDSGGYYYPDNYAVSSADNYQNIVNKKCSSKKLPTSLYSNTSQDPYYSPQRSKNSLLNSAYYISHTFYL